MGRRQAKQDASLAPEKDQRADKKRKEQQPQQVEAATEDQDAHISTRPTRARGSSKAPWWAGMSDGPAEAPAAAQPEAEPAAKRRRGAKDSEAAAGDEAAAPLQPSNVAEQQGGEAGSHAEDEGAAAGAPAQAASRDSRRPSGVSKIDLTAVWGHAPTPAGATADSAPRAGQGERRRSRAAAARAQACAQRWLQVWHPVGGQPAGGAEPRVRTFGFGTSLLLLPKHAADAHNLRCRVLEAAMKARTAFAPGLHKPAAAQPGKRKLLPAPKAPVGALPRSMLFGQNFQIPRLSRQ